MEQMYLEYTEYAKARDKRREDGISDNHSEFSNKPKPKRNEDFGRRPERGSYGRRDIKHRDEPRHERSSRSPPRRHFE
jgi:hypothetical protein